MQNSYSLLRVLLGITLVTTWGVNRTQAAGTQPIVAIHDSELTRALATMPATGLTPTNGDTGFQWWLTNWNYFVMPEAMKEALRSDGTAFTVLGDSNISSGALLDGNGKPQYPILISLASEAISDDEIGPLTNYVAAGGYLLAGSSAFTRFPDGSPRGHFAIASQMRMDSTTTNLANWVLDSTFTKTINHRLVSHIPNGMLQWKWPPSADEISLGLSPNYEGPENHYIWRVTANGATVIANGDTSPYLLVSPYGKGWFIYHAAMQPLVGHGGYDSGMFAYVIFRRAIEWAFQTAGMPVPKLSPWPYTYDAAVIFRHDMEDFPSFINSIESSAQYEHSAGAKGDYYFCTGPLRTNYSPGDQTNEVASLQRAIALYGATIGSHNGGLSNFYNTALSTNDYDFYHWGPDEVLDFTPPDGYANGQAYALASLSNSFADIEGWALTNGSGLRFFTAPSFNGTRERTLDLLQQLHVATVGEEKLSPFPHFVHSTEASGKTYSFVNMPVSDWYIGGRIAQTLESGHSTDTIQELVDFYYGLGTLINLYSHSAAAGASLSGNLGNGVLLATTPILAQAYVNYSLGKPRIWSANAEGIYHWWLVRSNAQITASTTTSGEESTTVVSISGSQDTNTAIEVLAPGDGLSGLQVWTNGILASGSYRATGQVIKVLVGTSVSMAQIQYTLNPAAQPDFYNGVQNVTLSMGAPGVLRNDVTGASGGSLSAVLVSGPAHGTLALNPDGSFTYAPGTNFFGTDSFTYEASDGVATSPATAVTISVIQAGTPPVLPTQADRHLVDLTTLTVVNTGTDSDLPAQTLSYQLLNPPAGMQIDSNGVIAWTPTLAQSPGTNVITTVVTDNGVPPLSATNAFTVVVSGPYDGINLSDPTQAVADPDGDGLSNLKEYALGTDPHNGDDAARVVVLSVNSNAGSQFLTMQFKRRTSSNGLNLQYLPEVSADGQAWFSDSAHVMEVSVTALDPQFDWVTVRDQTPIASGSPRFFRLRVVEN